MSVDVHQKYQRGDKIGGRYAVYEPIFSGGMGEVYLCISLSDHIPFALKTIKSDGVMNEKRRSLFEHELRTWINLENHPNIVRCFALEELDHRQFIVLEWVTCEGGITMSLRDRLEREGALQPREAFNIVIDICRGLLHAQSRAPGIVHRDLKPNNILMAQGAVAKLTDFGLAALPSERRSTTGESDQVHEGKVQPAGIAGTPSYMAPEQWLGLPLDARTDIYAIGCILYELITGMRPYQARTTEGLREAHLHAPTPALPNIGITSCLKQIIESCLAKEPPKRYRNVATLLQSLEENYLAAFNASPRPLPPLQAFTAIDRINRGSAFYRLGRLRDAEKDLDEAITIDNTNPNAFSLRGLIRRDLRRLDSALADYERAISIDPTHMYAHTNLGVVLADKGQFDPALKAFYRAIELGPKEPIPLVNLAGALNRIGRHREALEDCTRAIDIDPHLASAYRQRASIYANLDMNDEALSDCNRALTLEPFEAWGYYRRGTTFARMGKYQEALEDLNKATDINPNFVEAIVDRGKVLDELEKYEDALKDYEMAIRVDANYPDSYFNRGVTLATLGRHMDAAVDLARAMELDPRNSLYSYNLGLILFRAGNTNQGLRFLDAAAALGRTEAKELADRVRRDLKQ